MTKFQKEFLGRCALLIIALALLIGGGAIVSMGVFASIETQGATPIGLPIIFGGAIALAGLALILGAVLPTGLFARMFGRVNNTTIWENPNAEDFRRPWM